MCLSLEFVQSVEPVVPEEFVAVRFVEPGGLGEVVVVAGPSEPMDFPVLFSVKG